MELLRLLYLSYFYSELNFHKFLITELTLAVFYIAEPPLAGLAAVVIPKLVAVLMNILSLS